MHTHTQTHKQTHTHEQTHTHTYTHEEKEKNKEVEIYLNNKILEQVKKIKYLGIIFDSKMTFRDHVNYVEEKCTKLIFTLSKSAKVTCGLKHTALKTI